MRVLGGLPRRAGREWEGRSLQELHRTKLRRDRDLLVRWARPGDKLLELRLVIRYVPEKSSWTWLLTNVPTDLSAEAIGEPCRLRWQIELLFKDWKSYADLHALQSENPAIVEGFIWASLYAAFIKRTLAQFAQLALARPISTRLAAMSGPQLLPLIAAWARSGFRAALLRNIVFFIEHNALPTHPKRRRPHDVLGLRCDGCARRSVPSWPSLAGHAVA